MHISFILEDALCGGLSIFLLCFGVSCLRQRKRLPLLTVRQAALLIFSCYLAAVLSLTGLHGLFRNPDFRLTNIFTGFDLTVFDGHIFKPIMQNLFLLMPLGFLMPSVTPKIDWRLWKILLLGFGVSLTIELLQGFVGRQQEVDDLIVNTAGAGTGYILWAVLFRKDLRLWQRILMLVLTVFVLHSGMYFIRLKCLL